MRHSPGPTRRELFKLVGFAAGLAVVGGSAAACGELDSEQQNVLVDSWRMSRSDISLAESSKQQFDPESAEYGALDRVIEARTVHRDALVEALEAAGEELPADEAEGEGAAPGTPDSAEATGLDQVVEALTASSETARKAAAILEGYPSALAGSVGAACSALAQVSLGMALGRAR